MDAVHNSLISKLRNAQLQAGGPVSLSQFLRLARPIIRPLRAQRVPWAWLASRILAVHQTSVEAVIPADLSDATDREVKIISTLWLRIASETGATHGEMGIVQETVSATETSLTAAPHEAAPARSPNVPKTAPVATGPPKMPASMQRILHDHEQAEKIGKLQ